MSIYLTWSKAFGESKFRFQFILFLLLIAALVIYLPNYFHQVIGPKTGLLLHDPLFSIFTPTDYSWLIFALIYAAVILVLSKLIYHPQRFLLGLKYYFLITSLRIVSMYLFTLEAPAGIIILSDPLIDIIGYGGKPFTKDLFFSGHVSTLCLLIVLESRKTIRLILIVVTALVAVMLIAQRVHYTIDVLAAIMVVALIHFGMIRFNQTARSI